MHKRCRGFELEAEPLSFYHIMRKGQPSVHAVNFTTDVLRDLQFDEAEQCKRSVILKDYNNFRLWNVHSPLFSRISMQLLNAGPDPPPRVLHDKQRGWEQSIQT